MRLCKFRLALLGMILVVATAPAGAPAPPPALLTRLAAADCVVAGKVVSIEAKPVFALPYPGAKDKVEFQIAVVKIDDPIVRAKDLTHIRVGFIVANPKEFRRMPQVNLVKDQEVCLFLQPHHEANFHIYPMYYDVLSKTGNPSYLKELEELKRLGKLLKEPNEGLKAKNANERYETAAMLLTQYRRERPGTTTKEEPIDAEQSKLILTILAETDWKNHERLLWGAPQTLFFSLGLTEKDGWTPPLIGMTKQIDFTKLPDAAKKWCQDNAATYRIKRWVSEKTDKKE